MMYDLMLELPVFQGLSYEQLTTIIEKVPFHFKKYKSNDYLIRNGEQCDEIVFLLSGRVRVLTPSFKDSIIIAEDFEAPHTISFYNLFGRDTTTRSSIYAQGAVGVMSLNKENFLHMISDNKLMLINVLNILSSHAQKQHMVLDTMGIEEPELRLGSFIVAYTSQRAKNVIIDAEPSDWCSMLRLEQKELVEAIQSLIDKGFVENQEGKLKLTDRYGLRMYLSHNFAQK